MLAGRALGALGALALSGGCIAYATPPLRVSAGIGPRIGRFVPLPAPGAEDREDAIPATTVSGRVGIEPLGMIEELADRVVSPTAGYVFELVPRGDLLRLARHGGFLGLVHYPWTGDSHSGGCRARVPIGAAADVLASEGHVGGGLTFTLGVELDCFVEGESEGTPPDEALVAYYLGEVGLGAELGVSAHTLDGAAYWVGQLSLVLHLPSTAGIAILPVWDWL
ncbi:MAG: hypothetical protein IT373_27600 [Polyangiaceae bacterium]|nr:hypothetical protein [Polyangiaceae bacterium]